MFQNVKLFSKYDDGKGRVRRYTNSIRNSNAKTSTKKTNTEKE